MKIVQIQMPVPAVKEDAVALAENIIDRDVPKDADLVLLPEMFCCPYETVNFPVYAEPEGGDVWKACSEIAEKNGFWFSAGTMPERGADGRIYNTAYVFDRTGRQAAKHRKMHLFDIDIKDGQRFHESETLTAGDQITVFGTEFGKLGLCICYDFRFPELTRLMALEGAQAILVPAAFNMSTGPMHWELMFRSQAMFNQVFAFGTAPARDPEASYQSWAHSIAVDPWGNVLSQMEETPGVIVIDIDLDDTGDVWEQLPLTRHRRTDVYSLVKK